MAFSYHNYTGDNSTTTFNIPFTYTATSEISVTVDGVAETGLTFPSSTEVTLTSAPASGTLVQVKRTTVLTSRAVDFVSGSVLTEEDLDNSNIQVFHASQEAVDTANDALALDLDDEWDANNKVIKNVADPVNNKDAVNKQFISTNLPNITTVAGIASDVTTVANNDANVTAVAADATDIGTVSTNIASVNTVATNISDVITVANDLNEAISEIETAADDLNEAVSEIDTVATSISSVNTVGTNIANVTAVANNATNINTVAGISADVTTVAGISTDVAAVEDIASNVTAVAGISSDVTTVAGDSADIQAVAADATDIGTVATNIANVNTVSGSIANVNTTASNITGVNSFAERYRVGSSDPTTSLDEGDLFFNTTSNEYKFYDGSAWQAVNVSGLGSVLEDTTPQLGGNLDLNSNNITGTGNIDVTGSLQLSSTTPIITLTDTDTGADHRINASSGAGNLAFDIDVNSETASPSAVFNIKGSEAMRINSSGNVGIGTTVISNQISLPIGQTVNIGATAGTSHQAGNVGSVGLTITDGGLANGVRVHNTHNGTYSSSDIRFTTGIGGVTSGLERMRIESSGNVGIGGTDTQLFNGSGGTMKFVVIGDDSTTTVANNTDAGIAIVNTNQTAGNLAGLHFARADTDNAPNYAGASIVAQFPDAQVTGQYPRGELAFLTSTAANTAPSEKMRITSSGIDITGGFTATSGSTITTADNTTQLTLKSTDADNAEGPRLDFVRDSVSPADNDQIGVMRFMAEDSVGNNLVYSEINVVAKDVTSGTLDSELKFQVRRNNNIREAMSLSHTDVVFNENGDDVDFRIESDGNSNMLRINAGTNKVGIGKAPTQGVLDVNGIIYGLSEGGAATTSVQQGLCKQWINFKGTGTLSIRDSFNTSSINDQGTGKYLVTIANNMNNSLWSAFLQADLDDTAGGIYNLNPDIYSSGTGSYGVGTYTASNFGNLAYNRSGLFGDLA